MEQWRAVPGYEGFYEVSDQGNVRSLPRMVAHPKTGVRPSPGKVLSPARRKDGRRYVALSKEGVVRHGAVARIMLEAFVGPANGRMALHKDDNRDNDNLPNLYWGTNVENMSDKVKNGNSLKGSKHHKAQVYEAQVIEMRKRMDAGEDYRVVAEEYGLSLTATQSIKHRRTWKHI